MKRSFLRTRIAKLSSFTLVELLVVIAIIAILASVILASAGGIIRMANRTKAGQYANQIQTGVLSYYTEYSVYPISSTATANTDVAYFSSDQTDWQPLMFALCGNINAGNPTAFPGTTNVANTHGIAFLSPNKSSVDTNGIILNPQYPTGAGTYFNIAMDGNYDNLLGNNGTANNAITNFASAAMPTETITAGVAVWANCNSGTTTNNTFYIHTY